MKDPQGVRHELRGEGRALGGLREIPAKILALICSVISPLQVKMWVQLLIPRIEDGNNFGVSIQVRHPWLRALQQQGAALRERGFGVPPNRLVAASGCGHGAGLGFKTQI